MNRTAAPTFIAGIATVVSLLRNDVFFLPSLAGKVARISVSDESRKGGIDL